LRNASPTLVLPLAFGLLFATYVTTSVYAGLWKDKLDGKPTEASAKRQLVQGQVKPDHFLEVVREGWMVGRFKVRVRCGCRRSSQIL
jgi:hypothetical protein